jgi:two-component system response regulator GlrR
VKASPAAGDGVTLREARDRFTKSYLESLLEKVAGNVSRAAEQAGKHRSDFYELLNRYRIDPARFRKGHPEETSAGASAASPV